MARHRNALRQTPPKLPSRRQPRRHADLDQIRLDQHGLAEFERELISERTKAGLASARARGRNGGRPYKMTPAKIRLAQASMGKQDTNVSALCKELGITRQTLYRHVSPAGQLRDAGQKLLAQRR